MKTTLKILPLLFGVMLFFTQCEKEAELEQTVNAEAFMNLKAGHVVPIVNKAEQELWAGAGQNDTEKGYLVGKVIAEITMDGNDELILTVEYDMDESWKAIEYHLWVGSDFQYIPQNAAPGQFPFSGYAEDGNIFEINLSEELGILTGDFVYIAAHAVVANADYDALNLPESVGFELLEFPGAVSYFDIEIEDGGILTGEHDSWCIDPSLPIGPNASLTHPFYQADVYLSLDFEYEGMDFGKVNWILNFAAPLVPEVYSMGDVQTAIWRVLFGDSFTVVGTAPSFTEANVTAIVEAAQSDFIPGCNDFVGIILLTEGELQPIIIPFRVPCGEETAWAIGQYEFMNTLRDGPRQRPIANKWGWFFKMVYQ